MLRANTPFKWLALSIAAGGLSACASFDGSIEPSVSTSSKIEDISSGNYTATGAYGQLDGLDTDDAKKLFRNSYIQLHLRAHDARYEDFKRQLSREIRGTNFGLDVGVLALTGVGSLVNGKAANILSAGAAGLTGTRAALFREVYFQQSLPALLMKMDAKRLSAKTAILEKATLKSIIDYPLWAAMADLDNYENTGSLNDAITETVGKATSEATSEKAQAVREYENLIQTCTVEAAAAQVWGKIASALGKLNPQRDEPILDTVSDVMGTDKTGDFEAQKQEILTKIASYCSKVAAEGIEAQLRLKSKLVIP